MLDFWLTPWRASLSMTAATLETLIAAQKSVSILAPMGVASPMTEDKLRDAFQIAADEKRHAEVRIVVEELQRDQHAFRAGVHGPRGDAVEDIDRQRDIERQAGDFQLALQDAAILIDGDLDIAGFVSGRIDQFLWKSRRVETEFMPRPNRFCSRSHSWTPRLFIPESCGRFRLFVSRPCLPAMFFVLAAGVDVTLRDVP